MRGLHRISYEIGRGPSQLLLGSKETGGLVSRPLQLTLPDD